MSVHDDLTAVQRSLNDLVRCVGRLEQQVGSDGLDIRRVRTDADHLRESVALLRASAPPEPARPKRVPIPDTPYDAALWVGAEDEGLGSREGHAP
ncbi:hypothetical protein [Streptomyces zagrosensis]|uniref:Uncharacterized protein n=1 Tax=Streptomyces zagrosensis TaxID=1042984 RepID=A0A7W9QAL9_9ACTN|nr:hypothetical protein [Streptomyces zagrosensis]MBB5936701.1 hypothetical protein [Streptomyces zagrosensis]